MNGSIEVDSEKGHGAEFSVTITLRNCDSKKVDYSQKINLEGIYVLIVDDDPIEAEHARMVLEEVGINAEICSSGQEALNRMEVQHAKQTPYNLILMDWNTPGMSGMETAAEINKLYNEESVVVAMTAYSWDDIHEEARKVGVDNYLSKPLFATNIIKNIERIASRCNKPIFKEKKQANLKGRRILLAEDVDINAEIMIDSLEMENIMTDRAGNGKEAVEMFENSTEGIYSAILMDVRMPEMDGLEATEKIRSLNRPDAKRIPIIALTANAFDEDIQHSIQLGMNAHLSKPVEAEQLIKILGELIYAAEMQ
jgi:CheY-like chemotaxis protein